jgi:acetyl esterase
VLPACGVFQVSDMARFGRRRALPTWLTDRLHEVADAYLPGHLDRVTDPPLLADPLLVLESEVEPARALPPFFVPVGTRDPLLDDTRRLKAALDRRGVRCEARYYEGELHAFHALVFRPMAQRCWSETYRFLDEVVGPSR